MNHAHWTNKVETFYSYATGNIYYTIQKNYNEVKSSTSLACAVSNFLKLNNAQLATCQLKLIL